MESALTLLPGAALADEAERLAGLQRKGAAVHRAGGVAAGVEFDLEVFDFEQGDTGSLKKETKEFLRTDRGDVAQHRPRKWVANFSPSIVLNVSLAVRVGTLLCFRASTESPVVWRSRAAMTV